MYEFKSIRQLSEELLGVRLGAANTSLWSIGATLVERARTAVNEALDTYPVTYPAMYYSATLSSGAPIVLPSNIKSVTSLRTWSHSNSPSVNVTDIRHVPSLTTNLLYVNRLPRLNLLGVGVEMEVEVDVYDLPSDVVAAQTVTIGAQAVVISGSMIAGIWPEMGYLEFTPPPNINTSQREVVQYGGVNAQGFLNLTRAVSGGAVEWTTGAVISAVVPFIPGMTAVVQKAAQANMYQFWMAHRMQYDRYVALSGVQAIDMPTVLTLVRTLQDEADRKYARVMKRVPSVGFVRRKRGK